MKPHIFLEEEIHNIFCIIILVISNEVCHHGEPVYHNRDSILPPKGLWEAMMKSMLMTSQGLEGTRRGMQRPWRK